MTRKRAVIILILSALPLAICFLAPESEKRIHYRNDAELNQQLWGPQ